MQKFVFVVEGLGFGDNEDAWEVCGVYATRAAAERDIAEWAEDEVAEHGEAVLEYRVTDWPLNG